MLSEARYGAELQLEYRELGLTEGFGCTHFSRRTSDEVDALIEANRKDRRVKSIFGEGVSPRLRKLRLGLDHVGLPADKLLQHGSKRVVYGVALASNFKDVLIGLAKRPQYIVPQDNAEEVTRRIGDFWIKRWLSNRVLNEKVLADLESHTLVYPIEHGARVKMPPMDDGPSLFDFDE